MKVFCIGDIVSQTGRKMIHSHLKKVVTTHDVDLVIANGENLAHGRGITRKIYEEMSAIDVFTMGNHTWNCKDVVPLMTYRKNIIRPANFWYGCPGNGSTIVTTKSGQKVGIINIIGRTFMDPCDSPFKAVDREVKALSKKVNFIFVDFHAEATSEKMAMGWYLDGRVSAVFGTHTHVQTADEMILPKGTGYITDVGMTGPVYSVLGMDRDVVIDRFITGMPQKFEVAEGRAQLCGCIFEIDNKTHKAIGVERVFIRE